MEQWSRKQKIIFLGGIALVSITAWTLTAKLNTTAFRATSTTRAGNEEISLEPYCRNGYYNIPGEEVCSRAPNCGGLDYDSVASKPQPNPQSCMGDGDGGRQDKGCAGYVPVCCYEMARTGDFTKCVGYWERLWCPEVLCQQAKSRGASDSQCGGCQCGHAFNTYCGADKQPIPLAQRLGVTQAPSNTPPPPTATPSLTSVPHTATPVPPTATSSPPSNTPTLPPNTPTLSSTPPSATPTVYVPTQQPTPLPGQSGQPSQPIFPTTIPPIQPSSYDPPPSTMPTASAGEIDLWSPPVSFPTIEFTSPREVAREIVTIERVEKLNQTTEVPLAAVKAGVMKVKDVDHELEVFVQSYLDILFFKVKTLWNEITQ